MFEIKSRRVTQRGETRTWILQRCVVEYYGRELVGSWNAHSFSALNSRLLCVYVSVCVHARLFFHSFVRSSHLLTITAAAAQCQWRPSFQESLKLTRTQHMRGASVCGAGINVCSHFMGAGATIGLDISYVSYAVCDEMAGHSLHYYRR